MASPSIPSADPALAPRRRVLQMHARGQRFLFFCDPGDEPALARALGAQCAAGWLTVPETAALIGNLSLQVMADIAGGDA